MGKRKGKSKDQPKQLSKLAKLVLSTPPCSSDQQESAQTPPPEQNYFPGLHSWDESQDNPVIDSLSAIATDSDLINTLTQHLLTAQAQISAQVVQYQHLQSQHEALQQQSITQNHWIDNLTQRMHTLEQQLRTLQTAPKISPAAMPSDLEIPSDPIAADVIEELNAQIADLKQRLQEQTRSKQEAEMLIQTLTHELQTQTVVIAELQVQLQDLRRTAEIGAHHLNRWRNCHFST